MNVTRLDISLDQYEIGLTGAIPSREDWSEAAMDRGILEFVALVSGIVFKYGGRIIHGCHPTFTPIILRQARIHSGDRARKPVTLVMSDLWAKDMAQSDIAVMTDIAEFVVTPKIGGGWVDDPDTRNQSLTEMRRVLIGFQNIMVAVGGVMHSGDEVNPGVAEEMSMAEEKGIPRFLVGGLGGYARELAMSLTPASLNNGLSRDEDILLFGTDDISASVNLIFKQLSSGSLKPKSSSKT